MKKLFGFSALMVLLNASSHAASQSPIPSLVDDVEVKREMSVILKDVTGWCTSEKSNILFNLIRMKPEMEVVVEIGVWGGSSLLQMAKALKANGKGKIFGIDPWHPDASVVGMVGVNADWWKEAPHEAVYATLQQDIIKYDLSNQIELIRNTSANASVIPHIDMLHIDGNHSLEISLADVQKWVPHVKKGGIIVFDDVNWILDEAKKENVTDHAVAYLDQHCIKFAEYTGTNIWAVYIKP